MSRSSNDDNNDNDNDKAARKKAARKIHNATYYQKIKQRRETKEKTKEKKRLADKKRYQEQKKRTGKENMMTVPPSPRTPCPVQTPTAVSNQEVMTPAERHAMIMATFDDEANIIGSAESKKCLVAAEKRKYLACGSPDAYHHLLWKEADCYGGKPRKRVKVMPSLTTAAKQAALMPAPTSTGAAAAATASTCPTTTVTTATASTFQGNITPVFNQGRADNRDRNKKSKKRGLLKPPPAANNKNISASAVPQAPYTSPFPGASSGGGGTDSSADCTGSPMSL